LHKNALSDLGRRFFSAAAVRRRKSAARSDVYSRWGFFIMFLLLAVVIGSNGSERNFAYLLRCFPISDIPRR
jgi:hypothetical protein